MKNDDHGEAPSLFFQRLHEIVHSKDRASLAALRKSLSGEVSGQLGFYPVMGYALPRDLKPWVEDKYMLVAGLFAAHADIENPLLTYEGCLGESFRQLRNLSMENNNGNADALDRRFASLLEADMEDLPTRLRHAVSLLKSKGVGINWRMLLRDILQWNHADRFVQKSWARAYWRSTAGLVDKKAD